jgi:hypothetical protein
LEFEEGGLLVGVNVRRGDVSESSRLETIDVD